MTDATVLFVAVGGTRRRGVVEAAGRVVAAGGRASVIVGDPLSWEREAFDPRVHIVALGPLERRRIPMRIERGVLYTAPGLVLRAVARGSLASRAERVWTTYLTRVADRVHRRLAVPAIRSVFGDSRHRLLLQHVQAGPPPALIVVADVPSMTLAARLLGSGITAPVTFSVADALSA